MIEDSMGEESTALFSVMLLGFVLGIPWQTFAHCFSPFLAVKRLTKTFESVKASTLIHL